LLTLSYIVAIISDVLTRDKMLIEIVGFRIDKNINLAIYAFPSILL